jgi:hypothetical protein
MTIVPDVFGLGSPDWSPLVLWASQSGVTLRHGSRPGRLLTHSGADQLQRRAVAALSLQHGHRNALRAAEA